MCAIMHICLLACMHTYVHARMHTRTHVYTHRFAILMAGILFAFTSETTDLVIRSAVSVVLIHSTVLLYISVYIYDILHIYIYYIYI